MLASMTVVFMLAEIAFRIGARLSPDRLPDVLVADETLGWRPRPGIDREFLVADDRGVRREIVYRTDGRGSRHWDEPIQGRTRIMVVGDSFTMAKDVSQGETYYDTFAAELGVAVAALGADGYSILQEWMILGENLQRYRPHVVVWQLCENDFIGVLPELGMQSARNRCGVMQPYLNRSGEIFYANPDLGPFARAVAWLPSCALQGTARRLDLILHGKPTLETTIEKQIEEVGAGLPLFQDSVRIAELIFEQAKATLGSTPIVAFIVDKEAPYFEAFRDLCEKHGLYFASDVPEAIAQAHKQGESVFAEDRGHWNATGHRIAGQALARFLIAQGLVQAPESGRDATSCGFRRKRSVSRAEM